MDTIKVYILKKAYERYQMIDDRLAKIEPLIGWEVFRPIIARGIKFFFFHPSKAKQRVLGQKKPL